MNTPWLTITQGDTLPALEYTIEDEDGTVDLTGATVEIHLRPVDDTTTTTLTATISDAASGEIEYEWAAEDTDTAGLYVAEFEVTFDDGSVRTYPIDRRLMVRIRSQLA